MWDTANTLIQQAGLCCILVPIIYAGIVTAPVVHCTTVPMLACQALLLSCTQKDAFMCLACIVATEMSYSAEFVVTVCRVCGADCY